MAGGTFTAPGKGHEVGSGGLGGLGTSADQYNGRFNLYTLAVIVTGAMSGLLLGYENWVGISGGVQSMEMFQYKFFRNSTWEHNFGQASGDTQPYCKYADNIYQLGISILYLAGAFAAIGTEVLARKCGRKKSQARISYTQACSDIVDWLLQKSFADAVLQPFDDE